MADRSHEIVLALHDCANAGTCGSCKYFQRGESSEWSHTGFCKFRLPPTRQFMRTQWTGEEQPLDTVTDTDGCDFWITSGKTYIVSQRLKP